MTTAVTNAAESVAESHGVEIHHEELDVAAEKITTSDSVSHDVQGTVIS